MSVVVEECVWCIHDSIACEFKEWVCCVCDIRAPEYLLLVGKTSTCVCVALSVGYNSQ